MSDNEIRTLINTVTNLNKSKMFATEQTEGPLIASKKTLEKESKKRPDKISRKTSSTVRKVEQKQQKLQRSISVDSVKSK